MKRTLRRTLAALGAAGVVVALASPPVVAHVTVSSPDAAPGGYAKLVFRVPNESDSAATTRLRVTLPQDAPFASVATKPHPGWEVRVQEAKLPEPVDVGDLRLTEAVRTVTWTAQGEGIDVGMFDEFELSVGPIPEDATTLTFPTIQTYADGEVARWVQPTPDDGAEPEHPAPVLDLTQPATSESSHGDEAEASSDLAVTAADSDASGSDGDDGASDTTARTLAAGGLILGIVAVGSTFIRRHREGGD